MLINLWKTRRGAIVLCAMSALFFFLTFFRNWLVLQDHCFHCNDFALFTEALWKISHGDWNPFLASRQLHFFNDHWEPIFFPVALLYRPVAGLVTPGSFLLLFESLIYFFSAFLIFREAKDRRLGLLLFAGILLHGDWVSATHYPVRPSNWGLLPMAILAIFISREFIESRKVAWWRWASALVALSLANEQHAVTALCFFGVLAFLHEPKRESVKKIGLGLVLALQVWLAFRGRLWLLGPVKDYSYYFPKTWMEIFGQYANFRRDLDSVLGFLLPLSALFFLVVRKIWGEPREIGKRWRSFFLWGALFGPGLAGRFLCGSWHQYYNAPLLLSVIAIAFFVLRPPPPISRKVLLWGICLPLLGQAEDVKLLGEALFYGQSHRCFESFHDLARTGKLEAAIEDRKENLRRIHEFLDRRAGLRGPDTRPHVLVSDNLVATLNSHYHQMDFYMLGGQGIQDTGSFDAVIFERGGAGDPWPLTPAENEAVLRKIRELPGVQVIYESSSLVILEGSVPIEPLRESYSTERMKTW